MKTKMLLLAITLLIATLSSKAQVGGSPSSYIAVNFGTAYPLGNFASTTPPTGNNSSGYAQSGYDIGFIEGAAIKHSNFGISVKLDYTGNSFDIQSFVNNVAATENTGTQWVAESQGNWSAETILVGGFATIPVNRFSFDFRAMGGVMFATMPAFGAGSIINDTTIEVGFPSVNATTFAYDFGIGLRYSFSKHFGIMLNFDYLGGNPTFNTTENTLIAGNETQQSVTFNQSISLFNSTLAIAYQF